MPDEELTEGRTDAGAAGSPALPTPGSSVASESSAGGDDLRRDLGSVVSTVQGLVRRFDEFEQGLRTTLDDKVDARFKSARDTRFGDVEKISSYLRRYPDPAQALREMAVDELLAQQRTSAGVGETRQEDPGWAKAEALSAQYLLEAEIPFEDPEYVGLVERYRGRVDAAGWPDVVKAFSGRRRSKTVKSEAVGAASAAGAAGQASELGNDDLLARINELQAHPMANAKERKELVEQARRRGLLPKGPERARTRYESLG